MLFIENVLSLDALGKTEDFKLTGVFAFSRRVFDKKARLVINLLTSINGRISAALKTTKKSSFYLGSHSEGAFAIRSFSML